ncbi:glycoside hydrolase family 25 protein [Amycolatopsis sp. cg5]|uniref:glycoside hydrolase family 25 protein n=1 Tax=Amycolatopsis sp. cg5 TaxID=3238802 RepID=UPI0035263C76
MALGIDIYRANQKVTDWHAVKAHGVTYCWVKLTDGGGIAPKGPGDAEVAGAKSVGIAVGGYHFVQPTPGPERQAEIFIAEVNRLGATEVVPMLDMEDQSRPGAAKIPLAQKKPFSIRFCDRVRELGFRPGVYMNSGLARQLRPDQWGIPDLVIWIARYSGNKPHADAGRYDIHQYSETGHVPGIVAKGVDLNESYTDNHLLTTPFEEDDDMAGPLDHEYPGSDERQFHHRTIETRGISAVVGDVWFAVSAGYHDMKDVNVFFNGVQEPIHFDAIPADTRSVWQVPDGCESISWEYECAGPSSSVVIYGKR